MIIRYVNIEVGALEGTGTSLTSPWNFVQLTASLNDGATLSDDRTYYLSGVHYATGENLILDIDKTWPTTNRYIYFDNFPSGDPWRFVNYNTNGDTIIYLTDNSSSYVGRVTFRNGMFETRNGDVSFQNNNETGPVRFNFESVIIKTPFNKRISFAGRGVHSIDGSLLMSQGLQTDNSLTVLYLKNSIFSINDIYGVWAEDYGAVVVSDNTFVGTTATLFPSTNNNFVVEGDMLQNWTSASSLANSVSAYTSTNLSYLQDSFSAISVSGITTQTTENFWNQQRDGIGALYFDPLSGTITSNETSGLTPWTVTYSANPNIFISASKITWDYGDGTATSSYTTQTTATHTYTSAGTEVVATFTSLNGWYTAISNILELSAYESKNLSATIQILSASTSGTVTSASTNFKYYFSATGIEGNIYSYRWYEAGEFQTSAESTTPYSNYEISASHYYDIADVGNHTIWLYLNEKEVKNLTTSANLYLSAVNGATYYVDINSSYTTNGVGTIASPYNYTQFAARIVSGGLGAVKDTYRLRGGRILTRGTNARPWTAIDTDERKKLLIRDWDNSTYGPWILGVTDDYNENNTILSFRGCTLKNGILYNKPKLYGDTKYGGTFEFSNLYNMWVVKQGTGSRITMVPKPSLSASSITEPLISGCNIRGCTIYNDGSWDDNPLSATYDLNIEDTVISKFERVAYDFTSFLSATAYLRNSTFGSTSAVVEEHLIIGTSAASEFGWTLPDDWAMVYGDTGYGNSWAWITAHPATFSPSTFGIGEPPNPGYGYDIYPGYDTGLYGNSRKDYLNEGL